MDNKPIIWYYKATLESLMRHKDSAINFLKRAIQLNEKYRIKAEKDPDIFLFFDPEMLGSLEVHAFVNAIQVASEVIVQNSTREGFGLSLAEAMWKGKAVVGGPAEGMRLQIQDNKNGFLSSSPQELSKRIIQLIKNPQLAEKLGKAAQETIRKEFLIPRLLRDHLKTFKKLV